MDLTFPKSPIYLISKMYLAPRIWIRDLEKKAVQIGYFLSTQCLLPGVLKQRLTSVWRMAALCSLAVSDSLSTSMCCLQSEFWLLRVSSFVCKARSSDSFFESSCFSWSICEKWNYKKLEPQLLLFTFENYWILLISKNQWSFIQQGRPWVCLKIWLESHSVLGVWGGSLKVTQSRK